LSLRGYDVLCIGPFAGDSITTHLITPEAKSVSHRCFFCAQEWIEERFDLPTFTDAQHNMFRILK